jgi:hypothetical protein
MTTAARLVSYGRARRRRRLSVIKTLRWGLPVLVILLTGCGLHSSRHATTHISGSSAAQPAGSPPTSAVPAGSPAPAVPATSLTPTAPTTTTTAPCSLTGGAGTDQTVPVNQVCSATGTPHFTTPQAAMTYLASAWNTDNVRAIDYVTDPAGRQELDSMASLMVNLRFKYCTMNPAGDSTCYFSHDITSSTSPTTYPNPDNYPPGEAVFTVAPAGSPGWYLTNVIHCG